MECKCHESSAFTNVPELRWTLTNTFQKIT